MTLIDDDPDFLSVAPDLTFRSRSRYLDDVTGEWVSETEIIESAAELVELYNPADVYAAFAEAAREAAGLAPDADRRPRTCSRWPICRRRMPSRSTSAYAAAADQWAAGESRLAEPEDEEGAAQQLYDLALSFQERSQRSEARLLDDFADVSTRLSEKLGDVIIVDDDDERLVLKAGERVPRRGGAGRRRRRVAEPRQRRRDRGVLRPDRCLRRPGRCTGRGVPGSRSRDRPGRRQGRRGRRRRRRARRTTTTAADAADADAAVDVAEVTTDADATGDRDRA